MLEQLAEKRPALSVLGVMGRGWARPLALQFLAEGLRLKGQQLTGNETEAIVPRVLLTEALPAGREQHRIQQVALTPGRASPQGLWPHPDRSIPGRGLAPPLPLLTGCSH